MDDVAGLLLDIDGVLATSWEPLPGAIEAMTRIRGAGLPFRLITNTTTKTRQELTATLRTAGFQIDAEAIVTAVVATATYLRTHHPGARVFVLSDGDAAGDLDGIDVVATPDDADVAVIGGACDEFTYATMNRIFRRLMDGGALVGMHRNLYWRTAAGWELDGGAFLSGLEAAAGITATTCGKPAPAFFNAVLSLLELTPEHALMVGDDMVNDVLGAQAIGIRGILVRTGKFRPSDLEKGAPYRVIEGLADLPDQLGL
jgi:HAD superfamily hydrolase (TIGR01458 family)